MTEHNPETGRFQSSGQPSKLRWPSAIFVAVVIVAVAAIAGANYMNQRLAPTIKSLRSEVVRVTRRVDTLGSIVQANEQNTESWQQRADQTGQQVKVMRAQIQDQKIGLASSQAIQKFAAHDLERGIVILQDEQSNDKLNNREKTDKALRLLNEAHEALQPSHR
jgi:predicted lysophospholipase L1 biosynthesis ABC-type transport system permease subunit